MPPYFFAFVGALFAGLTLAFGAYGAHALKAVQDAESQTVWEKAVFYQAINSLAVLMLPGLSSIMTPKTLQVAAYLFIAGTVLFSGSLYLLAVSLFKAAIRT